MNHTKKRISVCIATYNGGLYIKSQLISILDQLNENDEIIISDDNSSDSTIEEIISIKDKRVKIYAVKKQLGVVKNFENSLLKASGKYIFLSDQDDIWLPGKVELCLSKLKENLLVVHDCEVYERVDQDCYGKLLSRSYFEDSNFTLGLIQNLTRNRFLGCCMAFKAEILKYVLPIPRGVIGHDAWIGVHAMLVGKIAKIDSILVRYSRHTKNASNYGRARYNIKLISIRLIQKLYFITMIYMRHISNRC
jgi:glycosyltransferase involved in cell wall biosynthesis